MLNITFKRRLFIVEKEINVILNHGAEDAECYGECTAQMLVTHQNEKPQLSISQVSINIALETKMVDNIKQQLLTLNTKCSMFKTT